MGGEAPMPSNATSSCNPEDYSCRQKLLCTRLISANHECLCLKQMACCAHVSKGLASLQSHHAVQMLYKTSNESLSSTAAGFCRIPASGSASNK